MRMILQLLEGPVQVGRSAITVEQLSPEIRELVACFRAQKKRKKATKSKMLQGVMYHSYPSRLVPSLIDPCYIIDIFVHSQLCKNT